MLALAAIAARAEDWPLVRHDLKHTGCSTEVLRPPWAVSWARHFDGEMIATATEPIVADGRVFVGTESGHLWALDARTGATLWQVEGDGPILHASRLWRWAGRLRDCRAAAHGGKRGHGAGALAL